VIRNVTIPAVECKCEACSWLWLSIAKDLPEACPNRDCRSREWNGKKKRAVKPRIQLPKPVKVRAYSDEDSTEF